MTTLHSITQTENAYRNMAMKAKYRPAAPSDGMGNITASAESLDLDAEAREYAIAWRRDEDDQRYPIGCPCYSDRPALIYIVEAARLLCGVEHDGAAALLRMALAELEAHRANN